MRLVITADTHGRHLAMPPIPDGDVLIHCGDCTRDIGQADLRSFLLWFEAQPHVRKLLIAGNHDGAFEKWPDLARLMVEEVAPSVTYLQDSGVEIGGLKFWGSPFSPSFCNWYFNRDRGESIKHHWDMIPDDTDVLITHGPPFGFLDVSGFGNEKVGCRDLRDAMYRVQPRLHCFGHIHHSYGQTKMVHDDGWKTILVNAACCNEKYQPVNHPWVIDL